MSDPTLRTASDLVASGLATPDRLRELERVAKRYAVAITPTMARLIDAADPSDPIARQFVPDPAELTHSPHELPDPIGDDAHSPVEGVVHRYPDRVLLKLLHACPVYCRFCFRREVVGPGGPNVLAPEALARAIDYVRTHPAIWEVILTGGDPLALGGRRLAEIGGSLSQIPHLRVLRIHTRVPLVDPARVNEELVAALRSFRGSVWVALHANHPREFTAQGERAIAALIDAGIPMVSQTVLLKGVNDDADVLSTLMRRFVENRVKPYYLHHPDLAPGTARFRPSIAEGQAFAKAMRGSLSGLAQPLYVLDIPGGFGKAPIAPPYLSSTDENSVVEDFRGQLRPYEDQVAAKRKPDSTA